MPNKLFRYFLLFGTLVLLCQTCQEDDPSVNASRLRIKLTDAASIILREFHLDIREISVFMVDTVTKEGEWTTLEFSGRVYDILTLTNGKMAEMVNQYVPAGRELQQLKLRFGDNSRIKLISDTVEVKTLHLPADLQDGLVIDAVNMEMRQNTISSVVIDVNAAFSFTQSDGTYFLTPMVRAFPENYGGKLRGYVGPLKANPLVAIVQDKDTLLSIPIRESDQMAMFQFIGLKEGDWEIHLIAGPDTNYQDTVFNFKVEAGKLNDITPKPIKLKPIPESETGPEG